MIHLSTATLCPPLDIGLTPVLFTSIEGMVGARIVEILTLYNITSLESNADAKPYMASLVRQGLFQANPVKGRISILVNPSNPDDLSDEPKRSASASKLDEWMEFDAAEIGGGEMKWIRFTVDFKIFLNSTHEARSDARAIGLWVFERAERGIRENKALGIKDSHGSNALLMLVTKTNKYEGGGPNAYSWNGQMWISALVESSYLNP